MFWELNTPLISITSSNKTFKCYMRTLYSAGTGLASLSGSDWLSACLPPKTVIGKDQLSQMPKCEYSQSLECDHYRGHDNQVQKPVDKKLKAASALMKKNRKVHFKQVEQIGIKVCCKMRKCQILASCTIVRNQSLLLFLKVKVLEIE